jgi:cold shock CspA family protein
MRADRPAASIGWQLARRQFIAECEAREVCHRVTEVSSMNGTIRSLSAMSPSGFIRAENGLNIYFESSAVLPPGFSALATGQVVTFDLAGGKWSAAINVRVPREPRAAPTAPQEHATRPGTYLQYLGFDQAGSIRAYRFRKISPGEKGREFIVNADLALFSKYHVAIQEGPALSLCVLSKGAAAWAPSQSISDVDMLAHLARRPAPPPPRGRKQ